MTRGKYADRARTKRTADAATVEAVRQLNQARARIRTLEHYEVELQSARELVADLRAALDAKTAPVVAELTDALRLATNKNKLLRQRHSALSELLNAILDDTVDYLMHARPSTKGPEATQWIADYVAALAPWMNDDAAPPPLEDVAEVEAWLAEQVDGMRKHRSVQDHHGKERWKRKSTVHLRKHLRDLAKEYNEATGSDEADPASA